MALTQAEIKQILIDGFATITGTNIDPELGYDVMADAIFDAVEGLSGDIPTNIVETFNGRTGIVSPQSGDYTTTIVLEGTNLYYTDSRFDTSFSGKTTDDLTEGSSNLYFIEAPVDSKLYGRKDQAWEEIALTAEAVSFDDSNLPAEIQALNLTNVQEALEYLLNESINNFQVDPAP